MNPTLSELLQQAERLANETKLMATDVDVKKTLPEVLKDTNKLHARLAKDPKESNENALQANMMLAKSGVDLQLLTDKVQNLNLRKSFEPTVENWDTDVAGFLKNKLQNIIVDAIDETNANIFKQTERRKWHSRFADWEMEKSKLLNVLAECDDEELYLPRVVTVSKKSATPRTSLNRTQVLYAKELISYNKCQQRRESLLTTFYRLAENKLNDEAITEMWNVLNYMTKQTPVCITMDAVKTRHEAPQFMRHARRYLETGYRKHMDEVIQSSRKVSACGGIPNVYSKVKSFVRVQFQKPSTLTGLCDVIEGVPLWPHVLYSLRSGYPDTALQIFKEWNDPYSELCEVLQHEFHEVQMVPETDLRLHKMRTSLTLEYSRKVVQCNDPYKKAVYNIVLCCNPDDSHADVLCRIDDYLWMLLTLRRKIKQLSIADVQSIMKTRYGESCLSECEIIRTYFPILVLTGHFEAAIDYLALREEHEVHAVHMAIALNELSILGISDSELDSLTGSQAEDVTSVCCLNVKRLIIKYASKFERTDTLVAFNYYYLLRRYNAADKRNLMLRCITDYILGNYKTEVLDLIFGKPDSRDPLCLNG